MFISHPEFGGTETHVLSLAKRLRKYGIQTGVATYGGPFVPILRRQGISVHKVSRTKSSSSATAALALVSIVKKSGYDIVHAHDIESFRMLPHLAKRLPTIPRVITVHGVYYSMPELRCAARAANLVIAVSPIVRQRVIRAGAPEAKVKWIPNGIDLEKYAPTTHVIRYRRMLKLPPKAPIGLYAGRFQGDKWKIARKFILASEQVARKNSSFISVLVGYGAYRIQLSQLAKQVNQRLGRAAVRVLPPTTHMENYYRAANLVVGTGRVALEAMACGKPVITAGISGYEGIIGPKTWRRSVAHQFGDHGAIKRTTVRALSHDIHRLLAQPQLANLSGRFARTGVCQEFSIRQAAKSTRQVYMKTVSVRRRGIRTPVGIRR